MDIKPIQTRYAGCKFRSRAEARWAVFFDALGEAWEYEKQGYVLPSGPYLPDFWLPRWRLWVEVKGTVPDEGAFQKYRELRDATASAVAIMWHPIGASERGLLFCWNRRGDEVTAGDTPCGLFAHPNGSGVLVCTDYSVGLTQCADPQGRLSLPSIITSEQSYAGGPFLWQLMTDEEAFERAVTAARSARFEHGETP